MYGCYGNEPVKIRNEILKKKKEKGQFDQIAPFDY